MKRAHQLLIATTLALVTGFSAGFLTGGGMFKAIHRDELRNVVDAGQYQYLPAEGSLEEALKSGHYESCLAYPGVGIEFSGEDNNHNLIVKETPLTYPARKADIFPGMKIKTPLRVIVGDLGSPLKLESADGLKTKEVFLNRVMVKKCLRRLDKSNLAKPDLSVKNPLGQ